MGWDVGVGAPEAAGAAVEGLPERVGRAQVLGRAGVPGVQAAHWASEGLPIKTRLADRRRGTSAEQEAFLKLLTGYVDVLHTDRPLKTSKGGPDDQMEAYLIHCLNHVLLSSDAIRMGNAAAEGGAGGELSTSAAGLGTDDPSAGKDQGFTRPKVLLVYPFRKFAVEAVLHIADLLVSGEGDARMRLEKVKGGKAFLEQFGAGEEEEEEDGGGGGRGSKHAAGSRKPPDFQELFRGDVDDHFKFGIKVTKGAISLFSDFYSSDIVVTSPLGLVTLANDRDRADPLDFLSSVEIAVVDRADVLQMQNWEHVIELWGHLNRIPSKQHGVDIMRVRQWYLAGQARQYRQTVALSAFPSAELNAFFSQRCDNFEGLVKVVAPPRGVLAALEQQPKQLYERVAVGETADAEDRRFAHFMEKVVPRLEGAQTSGLVLFVRSYFDYVRMRKALSDRLISFVALSEYAERAEADRTRTQFMKGKAKVLLYSERAHFYHRYRVRGAKDVIFYSLPDHPEYFSELVNMVEVAPESRGSVTVLFHKYDSLQLGRVVGVRKAKSMLQAPGDSFMIA